MLCSLVAAQPFLNLCCPFIQALSFFTQPVLCSPFFHELRRVGANLQGDGVEVGFLGGSDLLPTGGGGGDRGGDLIRTSGSDGEGLMS